MGILIAPYLAILSTMLVILMMADEGSSVHSTVTVSRAIKSLDGTVKNYQESLRVANQDGHQNGTITTRVTMQGGSKNGCGFIFQVTGKSGNSVKDQFPKIHKHDCRGVYYRMRMTSPNAVYSKELKVGNDHAKEIRFGADGGHNTVVQEICFGFNAGTFESISNTNENLRAFCINNDLLKGCNKLTNDKLDDENLLNFSITTSGIYEIRLTDIQQLINEIEAVAKNNNNAKAVDEVCKKIEIVKSYYVASNDCRAERVYTQKYGDGSRVRKLTKREDINPEICSSYYEKQ